MKRQRPRLVAFMGDLHSGSRHAAAPAWAQAGPDADWLAGNLADCIRKIKAAAVGHDLDVLLGGDLVEGKHHDRGELWSQLLVDQRRAAVDLLKPLADIADQLISQTGTEVHAGLEGEDDRSVSEQLGADIYDPERFASPTKDYVLDWWHHGPGPSAKSGREQHVLLDIGQDRITRALRDGRAWPDAIVWHHAHVAPHPLLVDGRTWVGICGCWKLTDQHGRKRAPGRAPTIGALLWWPFSARMETVKYDIEQKAFQARVHAAAAQRARA